jgi:hypothetical protein
MSERHKERFMRMLSELDEQASLKSVPFKNPFTTPRPDLPGPQRCIGSSRSGGMCWRRFAAVGAAFWTGGQEVPGSNPGSPTVMSTTDGLRRPPSASRNTNQLRRI